MIEDTYRENGNTPVVLIAHSMGGPMCLHFLHQQAQKWKDTYIRALISLSGAWGGSTKAIKVYAVGKKEFYTKLAIDVDFTTPKIQNQRP